MTLQSTEYLARLTTSIIWCRETPSVTVTLSLWFITGLNSGSYPEPNSFFRSLASMPSDWVISDVLFSETNTVAGLYSPFLHVWYAKEMMNRTQRTISVKIKSNCFIQICLRFSLIYGLVHYNASKLILQWYHFYFIKHVRWHKVAALSGTQVPSSFIDPRKNMLSNEESKAKGLNRLIKAQLPLPPTAHAFDCGSKCTMSQLQQSTIVTILTIDRDGGAECNDLPSQTYTYTYIKKLLTQCHRF